ncbi:MAG: hypothetical protein WKF87_14990 [Chryseolinea sp.]
MRISSIGFILAICCSSCASVYIASLRNVPLLTQHGEFQGTMSFGNGLNANAAFALTNHIGIMAGALYANNKYQPFDNTYRIHRSGEAGLGYFGFKNQYSYEVYAGYGGGKGYAQDSTFGFFLANNTQHIFKGTYNKAFVQPTFAFRLKRFQFIVTSRVTRVDFTRLDLSVNNNIARNLPGRRFYFIEPSFTSKFFIKEAATSMFAFAQVGFNVAEQPELFVISLQYWLWYQVIAVGCSPIGGRF